MPGSEKLQQFLSKHVDSARSVADLIQETERAFKRAAKSRPSRVELRTKAENLQKASREIARSLGSANELHFFLRMARTLASDSDDGARRGLEEARAFDEKTKIIFANWRALEVGFQTIAEACETLTDANQKRPVFPKEGRPVDEEKKQLGFELAALWHWATGKAPAFSGSATFDKPGSEFGAFVALAAEAYGKDNLIKGFAAFVRRACEDYRQSELCTGLTGVERDGVETPKTF